MRSVRRRVRGGAAGVARAGGRDRPRCPGHRSNGAYLHDRRIGKRVTVAEAHSPRLSRHEADQLYDVTLTTGLEADVTLLIGPQNDSVVDPELYRRLARDLRANGSRVIADLSGAPLTAAVEGGIDLLKISDEELVRDAIVATASREGLVAGIESLHRTGAANVLVSRAAESSLALVDDELLEIAGPGFSAMDHRWAGDSMFAAIGVGLGGGEEPVDALRLGVAAGALNATRHGLGTGNRAEIERLVPMVEVRSVGEPASR